ncbi:MAG: polysaccharide export protein [Acidobacteriota bacterium]|nr:polysaccharide export protein [Acidobacteriota bacterium]
MEVSLKTVLNCVAGLLCVAAAWGAQSGPAPSQPPASVSTPEAATIGSAAATAPSAPAEAAPAAAPAQDLPPVRKPGSEVKPPGAKTGSADAQPYVIGPLDVLSIKVWGQQNLTSLYAVAADGTISMPLVGDVTADGLTRERLRDTIAKKLAECCFNNNPEVDVQVEKINSKRYFVYGGVGRSGQYPLIRPTTVMDALSEVGGFRDFANTKKIRIQRRLPSGETTEFKFNYKDVSKGRNMEQNIQIQNGDRIFVPE